jgi:hypothetical protein
MNFKEHLVRLDKIDNIDSSRFFQCFLEKDRELIRVNVDPDNMICWPSTIKEEGQYPIQKVDRSFSDKLSWVTRKEAIAYQLNEHSSLEAKPDNMISKSILTWAIILSGLLLTLLFL